MGRLRIGLSALLALQGVIACTNDSKHATADASSVDGGSDAGHAGDSGSIVTYWQDAAPIFAKHCMMCHQDGGIGPFSLTDYDGAKLEAQLLENEVVLRMMPPWPATRDSSCGTFSNVDRLSDEEIATLSAWVEGGTIEGTPVPIDVPPLPSLENASAYATPQFVPERQGTDPAQFNDSRCFVVDSGLRAPRFISGYQVDPGNDIVTQVLAWVVDPAAPSTVAGVTNADRIAALDTALPDRAGWPCSGGSAGDGIQVKRTAVLWGSRQGIVRYPSGSGIPIAASDRIVIQVQYDLDDDKDLGQSVQSTVHLAFVDSVTSVGNLVLHDAFLDSLNQPTPSSLAAGQSSVNIDWQATLSDLGLEGASAPKLAGVMPLMRQVGRSYRLTIGSANADSGSGGCGIDVQHWDPLWQRIYFYDQPYPMTPDTQLSVSCNYNTSGKQAPVLPGWGVLNEMCLAALYFTTAAN